MARTSVLPTMALLLLAALSPTPSSAIPRMLVSLAAAASRARIRASLVGPSAGAHRGAGASSLDIGGVPWTQDDRYAWIQTFNNHGGPLIVTPFKAVNIFYGDSWTSPDNKCAPDILRDLVRSISNTSANRNKSQGGVPSVNQWWQTVSKLGATSQVSWNATWRLNQSAFLDGQISALGSLFPDKKWVSIILAAWQKYNITNVPSYTRWNVFYNIFLPEYHSKDSGFCAYHTSFDLGGSSGRIYFGVYPHPKASIVGCGSNAAYFWSADSAAYGAHPVRVSTGEAYTPNNCLVADSLADTVLHEMSEHATDPDVDSPAWICDTTTDGTLCTYPNNCWNRANCENADICTIMAFRKDGLKGPINSSWPTGSPEYIAFEKASKVDPPKNHAWYNVQGIKGRKFYISPSLDAIKKACVMRGD